MGIGQWVPNTTLGKLLLWRKTVVLSKLMSLALASFCSLFSFLFDSFPD